MSLSNLFGTSLRFKLWRRRLSVAAPRVIIQRHLPWPLRVLLVGVILGLAGAIALGTYDLGRHLAGFHAGASRAELAGMKEELQQLSVERDQYSSAANAVESQLQIERSAQKQLLAQVKILETENARLKEDLAFFESLLPASTGGPGVAIRRLKVDIIAPNQLKYRILVMQGGKGARDFVGNLQLAVTVVQEGKSAIMTFPEGKPDEMEKYKLEFKHYQRLEGVLFLPEGASMKAVQARVLEKGQIRAQQSANL
jgi:hypothetical protein